MPVISIFVYNPFSPFSLFKGFYSRVIKTKWTRVNDKCSENLPFYRSLQTVMLVTVLRKDRKHSRGIKEIFLNQHYLFFPGYFKKLFFQAIVKEIDNSFCIKFLAFVSFSVFVNNDTIMCQYFRQEIKQKRTFEVDKNIFIRKPKLILS